MDEQGRYSEAQGQAQAQSHAALLPSDSRFSNRDMDPTPIHAVTTFGTLLLLFLKLVLLGTCIGLLSSWNSLIPIFFPDRHGTVHIIFLVVINFITVTCPSALILSLYGWKRVSATPAFLVFAIGLGVASATTSSLSKTVLSQYLSETINLYIAYGYFAIGVLGTAFFWAKFGLKEETGGDKTRRLFFVKFCSLMISIAAIIALYDTLIFKLFASYDSGSDMDQIIRSVIRLVVHPLFFTVLTAAAKSSGLYLVSVEDGHRPFAIMIHVLASFLTGRALVHSMGSLLGTALSVSLAGVWRLWWRATVFKRDAVIFRLYRWIKLKNAQKKYRINPASETELRIQSRAGGNVENESEDGADLEDPDETQTRTETESDKANKTMTRSLTYSRKEFKISQRRRDFYASVNEFEITMEICALFSVVSYSIMSEAFAGGSHVIDLVIISGLQLGVELIVGFLCLYIADRHLGLPVTATFRGVGTFYKFFAQCYFFFLVYGFFGIRIRAIWSKDWYYGVT